MSPTIKKIIILLLALVVMAVLIFFGWQGGQKYSAKPPLSQEPQSEKNKSNFISDEEIFKKAKEEKDISLCLDIKEEQIKSLCQEQAQNQVYNRIKNVMIPDMYYRDDIGERWFEDSDRLHNWGYLREP